MSARSASSRKVAYGEVGKSRTLTQEVVHIGTRGPIPSRDNDLNRPRERKGGDVQEAANAERLPVDIPPADLSWHPIAVRLYESAQTSGQRVFYQNSDWAILWSLCEDLSHYKQGSKGFDKETGELYNKARSGQMLQAIMSQLNSLLLTEGERRRVRIELQAPEEDRPDAQLILLKQLRESLDEA